VTAVWRYSLPSGERLKDMGSTAKISGGLRAPSSLLLDAAMNFAINAALRGRERTEATIELTTELLRPALVGESYALRGEVVRLTRQIAYAEATLVNGESKLVSRATGTFLVRRDDHA